MAFVTAGKSTDMFYRCSTRSNARGRVSVRVPYFPECASIVLMRFAVLIGSYVGANEALALAMPSTPGGRGSKMKRQAKAVAL
jgi:hypothetical protein